ncbi:MAG: tryptophan synthase subunit alpha, partial [Spirochaetota bacterium]|nr:tryptophan synthase subunit alpha [Spirochaetota bacterium]
NISLDDLFSHTKKLCDEVDKPLVYMMYFNQIFTYGMEAFLGKMKEIGVSGLIVPDLIPDSEPEFNDLAASKGIDLIFLMTPATHPDREPIILSNCKGFLYFVSVIGITGKRDHVNTEIKPVIERIRKVTDLPVCVGFGISTPEHVESVLQYSDGAIVGSAIVQKITDNIGSEKLVAEVTGMIRRMSSVKPDGDDK